LASASDIVDSFKSMLDEGMSINFTNTYISLPYMLHLNVANLEATRAVVQTGVALNKGNLDGDTQLKLAV
jgi:hypothetical protein